METRENGTLELETGESWDVEESQIFKMGW